MEYLYSRLMPIVDLLNVAKQCSRFPLKLFRCFWLCQLWNEPLQNTKPLKIKGNSIGATLGSRGPPMWPGFDC